MAISGLPCRLVIGLAVLAGASAQSTTATRGSCTIEEQWSCGNSTSVCNYQSWGCFHSSFAPHDQWCAYTNGGCCGSSSPECSSCTASGGAWHPQAGAVGNEGACIYESYTPPPTGAPDTTQPPTGTPTQAPTGAPNTTQARPGGVQPGDTVEVKCASDTTYHPAAVHNVSSAGIAVVYELMGHLYYCTPQVWRTVAADNGEVCGRHGGILPAWGGSKCCPSSCGECGAADCHARPGGRSSCCTRRIPDHYVCGKDGRAAPCTLVATLPFAQVRRLRGDGDAADGKTGTIGRLLREWSPAAWLGEWGVF